MSDQPSALKEILSTLGLLLGGLAVAAGVLVAAGWFVMRAESAPEPRYANMISTKIEFASPDCPIELPVGITFENEGDQTILKISYSIRVWDDGHSTVYDQNEYMTYESDRIIAPGHSFTECDPIPQFPGLLSLDVLAAPKFDVVINEVAVDEEEI